VIVLTQGKAPRPTAVALGLFDGVHLGHRAVLHAAAAHKAEGLLPAVFTFSAPSISYKQHRQVQFLYTDAQKQQLLAAQGMELIYSPLFPEIAPLTGEDFSARILRDLLRAQVVVCGEDFRFGKNAAWGTGELIRLGQSHGYRVECIPPVQLEGERVSSRRIRQLLADGHPEAAARLLGGDYRIGGIVEHGNQLGRTMGFPTLNQFFTSGQCTPRFGVYASVAYPEGSPVPAVTNIGMRPTIGDTSCPIGETYILDWEGTLYGRDIPVALKAFLRPEQRFDGIAALSRQLARDIAAARDYGAKHQQEEQQ